MVDGGGGVCVASENVLLVGNAVFGNRAEGSGGGVSLYQSSHNVTLTGNEIYSNSAKVAGAGIHKLIQQSNEDDARYRQREATARTLIHPSQLALNNVRLDQSYGLWKGSKQFSASLVSVLAPRNRSGLPRLLRDNRRR